METDDPVSRHRNSRSRRDEAAVPSVSGNAAVTSDKPKVLFQVLLQVGVHLDLKADLGERSEPSLGQKVSVPERAVAGKPRATPAGRHDPWPLVSVA
jgi:hypothetical protein